MTRTGSHDYEIRAQETEQYEISDEQPVCRPRLIFFDYRRIDIKSAPLPIPRTGCHEPDHLVVRMNMDTSPLLGREKELGTLDNLLGTVARGAGRVAGVEGALGTGKTALLHETVTRAIRAGFQVFTVAGSSYESSFQHHLIDRLLGDRPDPFPREPDLVCRHLYDRITAAARRFPVLLVVDDLHWCDLVSLQCLAFLARRLEHRRIGILCARLSGSDSADPVVAEELLRNSRAAVRIDLAPLSGAAADAVITRALGPVGADRRASIVRWTAGNPFLLGEVLSVLVRHREDPPPVREVVPAGVHTWLRGRAPSCLRTATALAVLGGGMSTEVIADATDQPVVETARAVRTLRELGLLSRDARPDFRQPIVHAALLNTVPAEERVRLCMVGARRLRRSGAPDRELIAYLMSSQIVDHPRTADLLMASVRSHRDSLPVREQAPMLRSVLSHNIATAARAELLHLLGSTELDLAAREAEAHLADAALLTTDTERRAVIVFERAQALQTLGRDDEAVRVLNGIEPGQAVELSHRLALLRATLSTNDPDLAPIPTGSPCDRDTTAGAIIAALNGAGTEGLAINESWHLLNPAGSSGLPLTWVLLVRSLIRSGEAARLLPLTTSWASQTRQGPQRRLLAHATQAEILLSLGQLTQASGEVYAAMTQLSPLTDTAQVPVLTALPPLIDTLVERGEFGAAARLLATAEVPPPTHWHGIALLACRGRLKHATGEAAGGLADLMRCGDRLADRAGRVPYPLAWRVHAIEAQLTLGDRGAACELAEEELHATREHGRVLDQGIALRAAGQAFGGTQGLRLLTDAAELIQGTGHRLELAKTWGELGSSLFGNGRWKAARDRLKRACMLADEIGAIGLRRTLETRLRETGGRLPDQIRGPSALTASEQRVASLATAGRSNPQIARALFVSRRAVEMHLTQVYRKLGITGRGELSGALGTRDPAP
ncbi:AAA family ATPase [Amycolatopsis azurea]|uniref:AAA family ATPase n=1 Tax=Amycolatopsis azurea TaxID=36819 RepID=UPI00382A2834